MKLLNFISLVPAALAIYKVYTQKDEIKSELESLQDEVNANMLSLRDDVEGELHTGNAMVDNFTITPVGYFHSIVDKYWDTAFFVTIKNNSDYICYLRGVRMSYNIAGNVADFYPYFIGNKIIQPNGSVTMRLGGTNNKIVFNQKNVRAQVRDELKAAGKGDCTKMYCNFQFVIGSQGFNDQQQFTRNNIIGKAYYENSDWDGVYSNNQSGDGTSVELFDGSL